MSLTSFSNSYAQYNPNCPFFCKQDSLQSRTSYVTRFRWRKKNHAATVGKSAHAFGEIIGEDLCITALNAEMLRCIKIKNDFYRLIGKRRKILTLQCLAIVLLSCCCITTSNHFSHARNNSALH